METRRLGRTGRNVGVVGFGAWQIGDAWGEVSETDAMGALHAAVESGITFFDTADVYGDGRSERLVGRLLREYDGLTVATKMGRRVPQSPEVYNLENFRAWNDRSRANLGVDTIDLVQLHCPPSEVYADDAVFDALDTMVEEQRIAAYGVSVETCEQALAAIRRPNVATVQIILNAFRLKPLEEVLPAAREAGWTTPPAWPRWNGSVLWSLKGRPWPNSPCGGSSTSRGSAWSSQGPATLTKRVATLPRPLWPRSRKPSTPVSARSTTS